MVWGADRGWEDTHKVKFVEIDRAGRSPSLRWGQGVLEFSRARTHL